MSKRLMEITWPDFSVYLCTMISKDGAQIKLAVTYRGETREKLMSCDEFAQMTGFDDARRLMAPPKRKRLRAGESNTEAGQK